MPKTATPKQVREFRQRVGATQTQLAEAWGLSQQTVSEFERGYRRVTRSLPTLKRLREVVAAS